MSVTLKPGILIPLLSASDKQIKLSSISSAGNVKGGTAELTIKLEFKNVILVIGNESFDEEFLKGYAYIQFQGIVNGAFVSGSYPIYPVQSLSTAGSDLLLNLQLLNHGGKTGSGSGPEFVDIES